MESGAQEKERANDNTAVTSITIRVVSWPRTVQWHYDNNIMDDIFNFTVVLFKAKIL